MKTEWDLSLLFRSDDDPLIESYRKGLKEKVDSFVEKWSKNDSYLKNPESLKQALEDYSALEIVGPGGGDGAGTKDSFYFWLRTQKNQNDPDLRAKYGKSIEFGSNLYNLLRFFTISLGKIKVEDQEKFIKNSSLKEYRHFLERIFEEAKYTLSVGEENIINLKEVPAHEYWEKMVSGFLSKEEHEVIGEDGNKVKKTFSELLALLSSPSKKARDSAAIAFNEILDKFSDVAETEINAILANKKIDDQLRKIDRPDFTRHLSDDISSETVDALIESVSSKFDISKRYYALKAKLLGEKQLEYHERNVVYGSTRKKYSYKEAFDLVHNMFLEMDKEFAEIFVRLNNGQIDVFPKKNKKEGAFCTDNLLYQPTYVMLNHTEELNDIMTLAHESGHAINSELMKKECNTLSCGMVVSTAEVASTFMEDFVTEKLLKEADEETRLTLMVNKLNDDISTIFRQAAGYKFEQMLHKEFRDKGYLSKKEIGEIFKKNMAAYMGSAVKQSAGCENWWIYWNHIRRFFYVYSYAFGLLISKTLQAKVRKNKAFIKNVKEFLASGTRDSPKNIFMKLGIDISKKEFWSEGLEEVEKLLNETEALAKKLKKI